MAVEERQRLSLAFQELTDLPPKCIRQYADTLEELDLSHNQFSEMRCLENFKRLDTLILDNNNVKSHTKFPPLNSLTTLWVNHNKIANLTVFVDNLVKSFPKLRYLCMMNNPAAPSYFNGGTYQQYRDYRQYVISQLPHLQALDDNKIDVDERREAERIYRQLPAPSPSSTNPARKKKSKRRKSKMADNLEAT
ncbi:leucine-rich melanocyte differentiation-associated protein-like [Ptychodera flava]|uniref:leucine-rich melanocyte differentiation-associated protein-like n=1 Tax=Ptychodera flava TaxID=63121 RepID=UPI00396A2815